MSGQKPPPVPAPQVDMIDCDVLVSYCDAPDFDGDWRYSAFCPDLDVAMDGRSAAEAMARLKDVVAFKVMADLRGSNDSDNPSDGRQPALSSEQKAEALADFLSEGRLVCRTTAAFAATAFR